jgi:hypothetical protein
MELYIPLTISGGYSKIYVCLYRERCDRFNEDVRSQG